MRTLAILTTVLFTACAGDSTTPPTVDDPSGDPGADSTLMGRVTAGDGSQGRGVEAIGGVASEVQVVALRDGGAEEVLGTGTVQADGRWSVAVEPGREHILLRAIGDAGESVGHAVIATTGQAGAVIATPPLTLETELEAQVYQELLDQGRDPDASDPTDVRARIDAATAVAWGQLAEPARSTTVVGLAAAVDAAQETETDGSAEFGLTLGQSDRFDATIAAAQQLDARLYDGMAASEAYAEFFIATDQALAARGIDSETRSRLGAWSGSAWRLALQGGDVDPTVVNAAMLTSARAEARWTTDAVLDAAAAAQADARIVADLAAACADLQRGVGAADTAADAVDAFERFEMEISGDGDVDGTFLARLGGIDPVEEAVALLAVSQAAAATTSLEADLDASLEASTRSGDVDALRLSDGVVTAWSSWRADVSAAVIASPALDAPDVSAELLVEAMGSFRAVE